MKKKNSTTSTANKSDRVAYALVDDKKRTAQPAADREVDVLYQRMGDRWYAFSLIDDDLFFSEVPAESPGPGKKPSA